MSLENKLKEEPSKLQLVPFYGVWKAYQDQKAGLPSFMDPRRPWYSTMSWSFYHNMLAYATAYAIISHM